MGLGTWISELTGQAEQDREKQREINAPKLVDHLISLGVQEPETINATIDRYVKTGEYRVPTVNDIRTLLPADKGDTFPVTQDVVSPVRLGKRVAMEGPNGQFTEAPELQGISEFLKAPEKQGYTSYVDAETGEEIRREPNTTGKVQTIKINRGKGGGGKPGPTTPAQKVDIQTLDNYQKLKASGKDVSSIQEEAEGAAQRLGIPVKVVRETTKTGGLMGWIKKKATGSDEETTEKTVIGGADTGAPPATDKRQAAAAWLKQNGAPVTEANIKAVIDRGVLDGD